MVNGGKARIHLDGREDVELEQGDDLYRRRICGCQVGGGKYWVGRGRGHCFGYGLKLDLINSVDSLYFCLYLRSCRLLRQTLLVSRTGVLALS